MADSGYIWLGSDGWYVRFAGSQSRAGPFKSRAIAELVKAGSIAVDTIRHLGE